MPILILTENELRSLLEMSELIPLMKEFVARRQQKSQ